MQMEAGLDTGPVLAETRTPIGAAETTADLQDRLALMGADRIPFTWQKLLGLALMCAGVVLMKVKTE